MCQVGFIKKIAYSIFFSLVIISVASSSDKALCEKAFSNVSSVGEHSEPYDKFLSIEALHKNGRTADIEYLFGEIKAIQPFIASSAISTIAAINDKDLNKRLFGMAVNLDINNLIIQNLQYFSLNGSEGFIKEYLESALSPLNQVWAMKAIAKQGHSSLGYLLKKDYLSYSANTLVQTYALYALVKLNVKMFERTQLVLDFANNPDPLVREVAAVILGELEPEESSKMLGHLMKDTNYRVRLSSLVSFTKVTNGEGKELILHTLMLNKQPDSELIAGALKRLPANLALDIANEYISSARSNEITLRVIESIASLNGGNATQLLAWGLQSNDVDHVLQSIFALAARKQINDRKLLNSLLYSSDKAIWNSASWAYLLFPCKPED